MYQIKNMNKKKNLFKAFTQDVSYNYHIVKTEDPIGHLIYLIKNGSELTTDTLEFSPTVIVEELIDNCGVKIEKIAPAIFFTEESNSEKLKYELDEKLSENYEFSNFIKTIKDEYRILEVKDSLLYKKDPEAYEKAKQEEYIGKQKDLLEKYKKQIEDQKKHREEHIMSYNNDLEKLLKDYFEEVIEFEKKDIVFEVEFKKIIDALIDYDTWIKIDDKQFLCNIHTISFNNDKIDVFLTDNENLYTATLKFDKTVLTTENVIKLTDNDKLPTTMTDYNFLAKLYDIKVEDVDQWEFKNETDRFHYVIDFLVPIFKENKKKKEKELIDKIKAEQGSDDE